MLLAPLTIQCSLQAHAVLYFYIYRKNRILTKVIPQLDKGLDRSDHQIVISAQINVAIVNGKIVPDAVTGIITADLHDLAGCQQPVFFLMCAKMVFDPIHFTCADGSGRIRHDLAQGKIMPPQNALI